MFDKMTNFYAIALAGRNSKLTRISPNALTARALGLEAKTAQLTPFSFGRRNPLDWSEPAQVHAVLVGGPCRERRPAIECPFLLASPCPVQYRPPAARRLCLAQAGPQDPETDCDRM